MNWIPRIHQRDSALSSDPPKSSFRALFRRHSPLPDLEIPVLRPHPFAAMHPPPIPVVASKQNDIEEECPVCLEPLSFSYRLPGEKPHIVPECGHALHEVCLLLVFSVPLIIASMYQACFCAVYGPLSGADRSMSKKSNIGVCGVCRRPMRVADSDAGKSNSLSSLPFLLVLR